MRMLCPTCRGKGSIPDPKYIGVPMFYCGPNGERCPTLLVKRVEGLVG